MQKYVYSPFALCKLSWTSWKVIIIFHYVRKFSLTTHNLTPDNHHGQCSAKLADTESLADTVFTDVKFSMSVCKTYAHSSSADLITSAYVFLQCSYLPFPSIQLSSTIKGSWLPWGGGLPCQVSRQPWLQYSIIEVLSRLTPVLHYRRFTSGHLWHTVQYFPQPSHTGEQHQGSWRTDN